MSKVTVIPSEIRIFFSEKRRSMVMDTFTRLLEVIIEVVAELIGADSEDLTIQKDWLHSEHMLKRIRPKSET